MQPTFTTRPDIRGTFGAVATTHWLATQTGMAVLERGGNAFDAAAAAGFVLQIVEPHLNGPGGELPAIVMRAGAQRAGGDLRAGAVSRPRRRVERLRRDGPRRRCPERACCPPSCRARSTAGCCCCATTARSSCAMCSRMRSSMRSAASRWCRASSATIIPAVDYFQTEWPSSGEVWLVNGKAAASGQAVPHAGHRRDLQAHSRRGGSRGRRPRSADRGGAPRLLQRLRRRGDRPLLPDPS